VKAILEAAAVDAERAASRMCFDQLQIDRARTNARGIRHMFV
jgi:hypothetical protein